MVDMDMVDISMSQTFLAQFGLVLHPAPPFLTPQWLETYFKFFGIFTIWTFGISSADIRRWLRKTITLSSPCKVWFLPQKIFLAFTSKDSVSLFFVVSTFSPVSVRPDPMTHIVPLHPQHIFWFLHQISIKWVIFFISCGFCSKKWVTCSLQLGLSVNILGAKVF